MTGFDVIFVKRYTSSIADFFQFRKINELLIYQRSLSFKWSFRTHNFNGNFEEFTLDHLTIGVTKKQRLSFKLRNMMSSIKTRVQELLHVV